MKGSRPTAPVIPAAQTTAEPKAYDCMIGEKIWQLFIRQYRLDNYSP